MHACGKSAEEKKTQRVLYFRYTSKTSMSEREDKMYAYRMKEDEEDQKQARQDRVESQV